VSRDQAAAVLDEAKRIAAQQAAERALASAQVEEHASPNALQRSLSAAEVHDQKGLRAQRKSVHAIPAGPRQVVARAAFTPVPLAVPAPMAIGRPAMPRVAAAEAERARAAAAGGTFAGGPPPQDVDVAHTGVNGFVAYRDYTRQQQQQQGRKVPQPPASQQQPPAKQWRGSSQHLLMASQTRQRVGAERGVLQNIGVQAPLNNYALDMSKDAPPHAVVTRASQYK